MTYINFLNKVPLAYSEDIEEDAPISFDVVSDDPLDQTTIRVYIDGDLVYNGYYFLPPFNDSTIAAVTVGADDGYHVDLINTQLFDNFVNVCASAETVGGGDYDIESWSFLVGDQVNTLYFNDVGGLKKINLRDLVGESQSRVRAFLTEDTAPSIPYNLIASIGGNRLEDGYSYLALSYNAFSTPDGYGVLIVRNEQDIDIYADGYSCYKGQITDDGKLYLINKDMNQIEVYYGLSELFLGAPREPDYIYSSTSTPALMSGEILTLHIVSGVSTKYAGGTRLYVGTENGMNRVECYDRANEDGTPFGADNLGISYSYSISSGSGTYKVIGGTVPKVTSISSDERNNIFMVVTQDGAGNGGVTQISLTTSKRIIYMDHDEGTLPSNTIRDIFGSGN
jgi:hypothetical protein